MDWSHPKGGYRDLVHEAKVPTACAGVTEGVVLGRVYTEDERVAMTAQAMVKHAAPIMPCIGERFLVTGGRYPMTMADTSYSIGTAGFLKSSMCREMRAGNYRAACNAIPLYKYAGGKDCTVRSNHCFGVITWRAEQMAACIRSLP